MILTLHSGPYQFGYWTCAAAFLFAALLSSFGQLRGTRKWLMVGGCLTTAAWAISMTLAMSPSRGLPLTSALEIIRNAIWISFLLSMQGFVRFSQRAKELALPIALTAGAASIIGIVILVVYSGRLMGWLGGNVGTVYPQLLLSVFAMVLIENLYRNCDVDGRWGIKTLCFGLGLIFTFDFVFYSDALFTGKIDPRFLEAQGFIDALAVPLLLLSVNRSKSWRNEIHISRDVAFHSAVLLGGGIYLLTMAALGVAIQKVGGWAALQMTFLVATVFAMLVIVSSRSFRSAIRVYINKHFFSHKYDYREVWLKFIRDISLQGQGKDLQNRIVHAVADIFDCPAGALWVLQPDENVFVPTVQWNLGGNLQSESADGPLVRYLTATGWIVDVPEYRRNPMYYRGLNLPAWLESQSRAWLVAPLIHNSQLQAFLVLGTPRAKVEITWEELDLLKTIGEQAASYLAEEQSLRALVDANRLEEFNRWSAFLVHDIKSIVGQMSLLVANAEKHAHDHAFQRDVVSTVANAVQRMRKMLEHLNSGRSNVVIPDTKINLQALLAQTGDKWRKSIPTLQVFAADGLMTVEANEESLASVLDHLIQNASEATGPGGQINLSLRWYGREAILEIQDDGPGMAPSFVQNELFKPLSSSKQNGFGLGVFQARQLVRGMKGRLEVETTPGTGTIMRVYLPIMEVESYIKERDREAI